MSTSQLLTAHDIHAQQRELKLQQLHALSCEIPSIEEFDDDQFVRLVESISAVTDEIGILARSIELDVAHLQALTTSGKRSCVHEIPPEDREKMLLRLIATTFVLLGAEPA